MREQPIHPCVSLPVLRAGNVPALTPSDGFLKIRHALDAIISDDSNRKFQKETHLILVCEFTMVEPAQVLPILLGNVSISTVFSRLPFCLLESTDT